MELDDLKVYKLAMALAEKIWIIVQKWNTFERLTVGKQWVDAADSVGANISESFGRYYFKDARLFLYYSRGSLSETKTWTTKAHNRNLITDEEYLDLSDASRDLWVRLNNYINSLGKNANQKT
jgi:four helix bundle protein